MQFHMCFSVKPRGTTTMYGKAHTKTITHTHTRTHTQNKLAGLGSRDLVLKLIAPLKLSTHTQPKSLSVKSSGKVLKGFNINDR